MSTSIFPNSELYDTGYCVLFVRGISPSALLAAVAGDKFHPILLDRMEAEAIKVDGEDLEEGDIPNLSMDDLRGSGMICSEGPLLRAGDYGDWSFVVESEGPYLASREILESVSRGTVSLTARLSETMSAWISYAEDGEILSRFDPLFPEQDHGKCPEVLEELTGYRGAIDAGERADSYESAFRKIQQELRCAVPQEADAAHLLAIRIPGGY